MILPAGNQPTQDTRLRYRGRDQHNNARTGVSDLTDAEQLTKNLWTLGWRDLTVTSGGTEVGWIKRNPDGRLTWWAAS